LARTAKSAGRNPFVNQVFVVGQDLREKQPRPQRRNPFVNQVFVVCRHQNTRLLLWAMICRNPFVNQVFVVGANGYWYRLSLASSQSLRKSGLCRRLYC